MISITDTPPAVWGKEEMEGLKAEYPDLQGATDAVTKYNPTPGTGRTGFMNVPPNNYPFYSDEEKYIPVMQADGGQLSEWTPMYNPTNEQAEADRQRAYETKVPHGYVAQGDKYKGQPTISLPVMSELHTDAEYGTTVGKDGQHSGGPFVLKVSPKMRVEELRKLIHETSGILPAVQKLSYAGKDLNDSQRSLEQYGVKFWNAKFPGWPLKIRRN